MAAPVLGALLPCDVAAPSPAGEVERNRAPSADGIESLKGRCERLVRSAGRLRERRRDLLVIEGAGARLLRPDRRG